jgi:hypothetical protein
MLSALWHRNIFLFGLIGLAAGMLFGTVPTSIPQIILVVNWLLEKDFLRKWKQLKSNKIFWILACLFFLHIFGMLYTENTQRGLADLRNKIPLILLPLIFFSTKPLNKQEFRLLFGFFFVSVFVSSICCYLVYAGYTKKTIIDVRKSSIFMSHIRFSLFIALAIIGLLYTSIKEKNILTKTICFITTVWLLFFMYKLEMATGFMSLIIVGGFLLIVFSFKWFPKKVSLSLIIIIIGATVYITSKAINSLKMFNKLPNHSSNILLSKTKNGRYYMQDTVFEMAENGNLITININEEELRREWNKKSALNFNGVDKKGNSLTFTILRYLASKGFTKDSVGVASLTKIDITEIENGSTNYKYSSVNSGLYGKWRELVYEYYNYKLGENPSGHSVTMRFEFWKISTFIIYQNPIFGVGTGDIQDSFNIMYNQTNSKLDAIWRLRCHNQYLAIGVAFGFFGLIIFLIYLIYPAFKLRKTLHYLYWPFFLIALLSFVTEDTLETQSGVTFFIFFQTLFLRLASFKETSLIKNPTE